MFPREKSSVFKSLLASAALTACGQSEETAENAPESPLATQEQLLQCRVNSQQLADLPGTQRLTTCGAETGWSIAGADINGDGLSDVAVGAPGDLSSRGSVCVVLGNSMLNMTTHTRSFPNDLGARAGHSVALGNVFGASNRVDLLVGGPRFSATLANRGTVYAVDGNNLPNFSLSSASKYQGAAASDEAGTALAVGDLTNDGLDDFVTSAPLGETTSTPANSGIVYIVKNTAAPSNHNLSLNYPHIFRIQNLAPTVPQTDLRAGTSLAVADFNGDGIKDLLVGLPRYDDAAGADSGAVFVFYGPLTGNRNLSSADVKLVGSAASELAGTALARVGDLNGDGKDEILVGAPGSGAAAGKVYLVHGGQPSGGVSLNSLISFTGVSGDRAGASLAAGDFNADSIPDMAVGAPGYQGDQGAVFLVHGDEPLMPTQSLLGFTTLEGENPGDKAGHSFANVGDFNGDGVPDLAIGAPFSNGGQGTVYLVGGEVPQNWYADVDGDGFGDAGAPPELDCVPPAGQWVANALDCNDADASINPDALELCSTAGVDDNCNGLTDEDGANDALFWARDADKDLYADPSEPLVQACVGPGTGWTLQDEILGSECADPDSDSDTNTHENAQEVCDNKDNNCNGDVDDGNAGIWYADVDRDGYGSDAEFFPYTAPCGAAPRPGYVNNRDDCNDRDNSVHPKTRWYVDNDGDGIGTSTLPYVESCTRPTSNPAISYVRRNDDCNDGDNTVSPILVEVCEPELSPQVDNNCRGGPDDTLAAITWFRDADGDGEGSATILGRFCGKPASSSKITGDCNDSEPASFHGNTEICEVHMSTPPHPDDRYVYVEQIDNDCDSDVNDTGDAIWWHGDGDRDTLAGTVFKLKRCTNPSDQPGEVQGKYLPNQTPIDCNDADASATVVRTWYQDVGGDGCGNPNITVTSCYAPSCNVPYSSTSGPTCD